MQVSRPSSDFGYALKAALMPPAKPSTLSLVGRFRLLCAPGCLRDEYSVSARNLKICQ